MLVSHESLTVFELFTIILDLNRNWVTSFTRNLSINLVEAYPCRDWLSTCWTVGQRLSTLPTGLMATVESHVFIL